MSTPIANNCASTVIPALRYQDAARAIDWLCHAFGFQKHAVYANPDGTIAHAELTFGDTGMIMLGSASNGGPMQAYLVPPREVDGKNTSSMSVIASDPDALYSQAQAAGADIVMPLEEMPYGGKAFSCRDLEGFLWHFGSYDPWSAK